MCCECQSQRRSFSNILRFMSVHVDKFVEFFCQGMIDAIAPVELFLEHPTRGSVWAHASSKSSSLKDADVHCAALELSRLSMPIVASLNSLRKGGRCEAGGRLV